MAFDYYKAPSQEIFDDIKQAAIQVWSQYDDTYGYATGKINKIKDITNVSDNAWYMIAMFDGNNQRKLFTLVKNEETRHAITQMYNATQTPQL